MKRLLEKLHMLNRLPLSDDTDKALLMIKEYLPELEIVEIPSGRECWTWIVPQKWVIKEAYISDGEKRLIDAREHILHVMSYSIPVDKWVSREELMKHIYCADSYTADMGYQVPARPDSIPWVIKCYQRDWGFCVQLNKLKSIVGDRFYVKIDSQFIDDTLKIGCLTIPGQSDETVVIITNTCHPAQVNDSISGVVVAVDVARKMQQDRINNKYTYKFLFLPETVGSIAYLSQNEHLIPKLKYGIFLEMLGNKNSFILQKSAQHDSKIDRIFESVLYETQTEFRTGKFREVICNDEIVFNGPGVGVPTVSLSRWPYPEYHTSDDTPDIIDEDMLKEASKLVTKALSILDQDRFPVRKFKGIAFLSRYGLWVEWRESAGHKVLNEKIEQVMMNLEGDLSVADIAHKLKINYDILKNFLDRLFDNNLIEWR